MAAFVDGRSQEKVITAEKKNPEEKRSWEAALIARGKDDIELVRFIRDRIIQKTGKSSLVEMKSYSDPYELAGIEFEMIALKGRTFLMGSPDSDKEAHPDEKPAHNVKVSPFWIGKYEVTWGLYEPYLAKNLINRSVAGSPSGIVDIISSPSEYLGSLDFATGSEADHPAIAMTQHAANKFCQWLSYKTGHFYRLPTEAEWEYACRAGTKEKYSCPEDRLAEYAVFDPDQVRVGYSKVGTKKPNPWGIYNMHGNVMEWCLDQYEPNLYPDRMSKAGIPVDPLERPTKRYPRVVRGGSWYDPAEDCRSASRFFSHPDWKGMEEQGGLFLWTMDNTPWLGFRIVRPLEIPTAEEMHFYWNGAGPEPENKSE